MDEDNTPWCNTLRVGDACKLSSSRTIWRGQQRGFHLTMKEATNFLEDHAALKPDHRGKNADVAWLSKTNAWQAAMIAPAKTKKIHVEYPRRTYFGQGLRFQLNSHSLRTVLNSGVDDS